MNAVKNNLLILSFFINTSFFQDTQENLEKKVIQERGVCQVPGVTWDPWVQNRTLNILKEAAGVQWWEEKIKKKADDLNGMFIDSN